MAAEQPNGMGAGSVDLSPDELKPRRVNPAALLVGIAVVLLGVGLLAFGLKTSSEKMTVEQRVEIQRNIFVLPVKEQVVQWRKWAADKKTDVDLRSEAITQLALLGDEQAVPLAVAALAEDSHKLRGTCAQALAHVGAKAGDAARQALLKALAQADDSDRRQIIWALVEIGEKEVFQRALDHYRTGEITTVQRLEGGAAFDPNKIAKLVSLDEIAKLAGDPSPSVRQLVATLLSADAQPKWIEPLLVLVKDQEIAVAREAATGLGKIADERARQPLLEALRKADDDSRSKFLEALRDGIGGVGLVLALDTVVTEPEPKNWFQLRQLFTLLHELADPRAGDALVSWVERAKPHKHWETEVGIALAEIGDVRGAKYIAARLGVENSEIYETAKFWQADEGGHMTKNDRPRIVGSRMLADLAVLHQDKQAELLESAEEAVIKWMTSRPQPHANGLRFLAVAGTKKGRDQMRKWAFPDDKLPAEGAQPPFPAAFETAQSALRYIGRLRDDASLTKLLDQYDRKEDKKLDITLEGLMAGGLAMLGMALRAVTYGASNGLAEWGPQRDDRAEKKLMEFIEDILWNEEARQQACRALAWIAGEDTVGKVVKKIGEYGAKKEPRQQYVAACYADVLSLRPVPSAVGMMVDLLRPELAISVRYALARAVGVTGLKDHPDVEKKLFDMIKDPELRNPAALALIMGGSAETAARTVAMYAPKEMLEALNELKDVYFAAYGYWSDKDLDSGNIYRWVENAEAMARVKIGEAPQEWARQRLQAQFDNLWFDNGPHSETRVVLRARLLKAARSGDAASRDGAIRTLLFMREKGSLMALRDEPGEVGEAGRKAFHRLMNPRLVQEDERLKQLQEEAKKKLPGE
jgi:hypothetical protein